MKSDEANMNQVFCEMFSLPKNTVDATLRLRAGQLPTLTVRTVVFRTGQLGQGTESKKFRLIPAEEKVGNHQDGQAA